MTVRVFYMKNFNINDMITSLPYATLLHRNKQYALNYMLISHILIFKKDQAGRRQNLLKALNFDLLEIL
jgi:hypothetical protein